MVLNVNRNGGTFIEWEDKFFALLVCLAMVGSSSLCAMGFAFAEFLVKKLIERKRKHTGGSFAESYEDNKPNDKDGD